MSKHHYHNYNAIANKRPESQVETFDNVNNEELDDTTVESETTTNTTITDVEPEIETPKTKLGYVSGCVRLNVRKAPHPKAEVVGIIDVGDEVTIDVDKSTNSFYKVSTPTADGFCMTQYITVD